MMDYKIPDPEHASFLDASPPFVRGGNGVKNIYACADGLAHFIDFDAFSLVSMPSVFGPSAIYHLPALTAPTKVSAVLIDVDGTLLDSEPVWLRVLEAAVAATLEKPGFVFGADDMPHVTGRPAIGHLSYALERYGAMSDIQLALNHYERLTQLALEGFLDGRTPFGLPTINAGGLELMDWLMGTSLPCAIVTSGPQAKAVGQLRVAFASAGLPDPINVFDAVVTGGNRALKGRAGTLSEFALKPHPWLYAESALSALGLQPSDVPNCFGIEDSASGLLSLRIAGMQSIVIPGGNAARSGLLGCSVGVAKDLSEVPYLMERAIRQGNDGA